MSKCGFRPIELHLTTMLFFLRYLLRFFGRGPPIGLALTATWIVIRPRPANPLAVNAAWWGDAAHGLMLLTAAHIQEPLRSGPS